MDHKDFIKIVVASNGNPDLIAKRVKAKMEWERAGTIILFYGIIFLLVSWIFANPMWGWVALAVGTGDWILCRLFRPITIEVNTTRRNVQPSHDEDNS